MNHIYRLCWSRALRAWVPASELAKNKGAQAKRSDEAEMTSLREKLNYATQRADQLMKSIEKMEVEPSVSGRALMVTFLSSSRVTSDESPGE